MIETLPPVVQLILREPPTSEELGDLELFRKYVRRLMPEFRAQAEWTASNFQYPRDQRDPQIQGFVIRPSTGLDPFSHFGKCFEPACRILNAQHVARSVGLYGDTVLMADRFTSAFLHGQRLTADYLAHLATLISVLLTLRPLFEAGVFRFYESARGFCELHARQFFAQVDEATEKVLHDVRKEIQFELVADKYLGISHEPSLVYRHVLTKRDLAKLSKGVSVEELGMAAYRKGVSAMVFESFLDLQNASDFKAVTFSDSRVSLLTAQFVERGSRYDEPEIWEASRSAVLPWVRDLSVAQIVQLREEAAGALPRLRAAMGKA